MIKVKLGRDRHVFFVSCFLWIWAPNIAQTHAHNSPYNNMYKIKKIRKNGIWYSVTTTKIRFGIFFSFDMFVFPRINPFDWRKRKKHKKHYCTKLVLIKGNINGVDWWWLGEAVCYFLHFTSYLLLFYFNRLFFFNCFFLLRFGKTSIW
jgi:hypothetical protein